MAITTSLDITRKRGDTFPIRLTLTDDGTAVDITGYTFKLTVDSSPDPPETTDPSATEIFQVAGVITAAASGQFEFRPLASDMNQTPETYFYDVEMIDPSGYIATIAKGKFTIQQDITK